MRFELFIATRYLRAKRRQAVIGVITGISIAGVAAGVASLLIALAINNGFRQDLQESLLRSTSHVNLMRVESDGIKDWRPLMERLAKEPHVIAAAPEIYEQVLISRGPRASGAVIKGIVPKYERKVSDLLNTVKAGSADALEEAPQQNDSTKGHVGPGLRPGQDGSETRPHTDTGKGGFMSTGETPAPTSKTTLGEMPAPTSQAHTDETSSSLQTHADKSVRATQSPTDVTQSPDDLEGVQQRVSAMPPIILGKGMADSLGATVGSVVLVTSPQGELTPFGMVPKYTRFRVAAIFNSGFYDYDSSWAFTRLSDAQQLFGLGDLISVIQFKLDDIYRAREIGSQLEQAAGKGFMSANWMDQNKSLFNALRLERLVTFITIGLIVFVAALNILISLIMMVMEKTRDIAVLMSMGTRRSQVRRMFIAQGLLIGVIGTAIGLVVGYGLSWAGGHYHFIPLAPEIYSIDYVPFAPHVMDGVWVALVAIGVSLVATLYPSWSAARILPAEALRYE